MKLKDSGDESRENESFFEHEWVSKIPFSKKKKKQKSPRVKLSNIECFWLLINSLILPSDSILSATPREEEAVLGIISCPKTTHTMDK